MINESLHPLELPLWQRFDIFIKLIFAQHIVNEKQAEWSKRLYLEHINVFNGFVEPGQVDKDEPQKFVKRFVELLASIDERGYNESLSYIPLDEYGVPQDGGHRIAACLALDKKIIVQRKPNIGSFEYSYRYFRKNGLSEQTMDAAALKIIEVVPTATLFVIYPTSRNYLDLIEDIIIKNTKLFYRKDVDLTEVGAVNAMRVIYSKELWLGSQENDFYGARSKASSCFPNGVGAVSVFLVQSTAEESLALKETIRRVVQIGKHSVHCTDTVDEALLLGQLFFNYNSVHHANYSSLRTYERYNVQLSAFKQYLSDTKIDLSDVCVDGGAVLACYGLRDSRDLDFLSTDAETETLESHLFDVHNHESFMYGVEMKELVCDPQYHFYWQGVKHVSLRLVCGYKQSRAEPKDLVDVQLMEKALAGLTPPPALKIKYKIRLFARKVKFKSKHKLKKYLSKYWGRNK